MNHTLQQSAVLEGSSENPQQPRSELLEARYKQIRERHPRLTEDQAFNYQYCKLYICTAQLQEQVEQASLEIEKLRELIDKVPGKARRNLTMQLQSGLSNEERRKRIRRTANQIARHYVCRVSKCHKSYGSEGSLNQHMKLKHHDLVDEECTP